MMHLKRIALTLCLIAMAAVPAFAAEEVHEGMPQLNAATYPSQIFWLIVSFLLLFWLLRTKALPKVSEILEARQDRVAADLDRATKLREDAEAALRRYEQVVAEAQDKAGTQIRETRERLIAESTARQAELDRTLAAKIADAEQRIGATRKAALADLHSVAVEVAQAATTRLVGVDVPREKAQAALDAVVAEAA